MFDWIFNNKYKKLEDKTEKGFSAVKGDMEKVGKWIKHLNERNQQAFELFTSIQQDLSSLKEGLSSIKERLSLYDSFLKNKQVLKKTPVFEKQTGVYDVYNSVQTGVQTGNFYDILKNLSSHERALVITLMSSDLKLSYEDLALLLGKERSTIRGQINAIKQKSEGLIHEISEKNGKKRVFVPDEIKDKLSKYAKVRVGRVNKSSVNSKDVEKKDEKVKSED